MDSAPVDAPPRPPVPRTAARATVVLVLCSALLLTLVANEWRPLIDTDGDLATDWVWDPWSMRLVAAAAVGWPAWRRSARWTAVWLAVRVGVGSLLLQALEAAVDRPRPVWPDPVDSAFPSGHAMTATVVCGLLLWLAHHYGAPRPVWRTAPTAAVVSVVGVGLTRVWLGVHWPSDVLGGWLLGALVVVLAVLLHRRWAPSPSPYRADGAAPFGHAP